MAGVNISSIMQKVNAYSRSSRGKKKMNGVLNKYRQEGRSKTDGGGELLTSTIMASLANELIQILKTTAASYDLAPSVMAHFNNLTYVVSDIGNNKFECYIYFADDLSRESLETDYNQGEGINNIIALFNNGYTASAPKYGWWNGHTPTGESIMHSLTGDEPYAFVKGRDSRPALRFMQTAIEDFYHKYSGKYAMTVTLNDDYDGDYVSY